jgi:hypothetical protein
MRSAQLEKEGFSMMSRLKARLSFANAVPVLALFVALGGSAYAAGVVPVNSVGTPQLKAGSVTSGKVKDGKLRAVDFARNQLQAGPKGAAGPAGPAGPAGVLDPSQFYTKALSDARYLGRGIVSVVASATVTALTTGTATATCPSGYQATSGGMDTSNVTILTLSGSQPVIGSNGGNIIDVPAGLHGAPTAWRAFARMAAGAPQTLKVVVICAPIG